MSWVPESPPRYGPLDWVGVRLVRCGAIPRHVAFIMDGNRRFARVNNIEKIQGHSQGFDKMAEVLQWCNDLGVQEVTVYAFSIENFKRPQSEVESLLDLARDKFRRLISERDRLRERGVRVRVIGKVALLPQDLQDLVREAESVTAQNDGRLLNVAFSYTSREEMSQAVRTTARASELGLLEPEDITEELLERCLYTGQDNSVDLLIRTSGEVRLSDFLLWQSCGPSTTVHFTGSLWPDFSCRELLWAVFQYQRGSSEDERQRSDRHKLDRNEVCSKSEERISGFLDWLRKQEQQEEQEGRE